MQFHQLPLKLFVVNNEGYLSIRQSENKFFAGHLVAEGPTSKVPFPNFEKVVKAFDLPYYRIDSIASAKEVLPKIFADNKPAVIEVISQPLQSVVPTSQSMMKPDGTIVSKPLEDMFPYLDREVFEKEMIVKPISDK
jgi:acetolactate synthase-1/2/3 large subunit